MSKFITGILKRHSTSATSSDAGSHSTSTTASSTPIVTSSSSMHPSVSSTQARRGSDHTRPVAKPTGSITSTTGRIRDGSLHRTGSSTARNTSHNQTSSSSTRHSTSTSTTRRPAASTSNAHRPAASTSTTPTAVTNPLPPPRLSLWSTPAIPESAWCSGNFLLGAGMILFQRSTKKVVVVQDSVRKHWFFPKGRKDVGESIEQAALREAYEESGYKAEFMPIWNPSLAPRPPGQDDLYNDFNTEPIYVTTLSWKDRKRRTFINSEKKEERLPERPGYVYLTSWFVGQIADDAVPEKGTGMEDEKNYVGHLLEIEDAYKKVYAPVERLVLEYAVMLYEATLEVENARREAEIKQQFDDAEIVQLETADDK